MRSHIVITSPAYGGAEKRFFDIFTALLRTGCDVRFIAPVALVDALRKDHPGRTDALNALIPVPSDPWTPGGFIKAFRRVLAGLPRGAAYHYPLNCLWPLHIGRGDRVTMSVVDCARVPRPTSKRRVDLWDWLSFFFVKRVDVLSPTVFEAMNGYQMAGRMSLTPGGTFLLPEIEPSAGKTNSAVLLGRLVEKKGLDDFFDVLPALWDKLKGKVADDFEFQIAGYGPLEQRVVARVGALAAAGVPVRFLGYANANELLPTSSIVFTMQEITNFPSRVVAEAMSAGCGVIVRDTGDSRQFGEGLPGLLYCKAQLDAEEIASQILRLTQDFATTPGFRQSICAAATNAFSAPSYIEYFRVLFVPSAGARGDHGQTYLR
ncbi:glycosyltransferase [Noviherbaspirillum aridicola]|uniref:Glycosyltransferase involved in cell wall biosynthesis n=1 Tax=Noviherbaspirillum aridicola TaxID=2849687 RepID=A0ABQ4Q3D2_9BURK|nr:glycosyltransferase [Noviherbaspirillum aridicola]GIZ51310.1 hypothetical protein NCCP691_13240 [Noviherbaspirillum aridicola]